MRSYTLPSPQTDLCLPFVHAQAELVPGKSARLEERAKDMFDEFRCAPTGFVGELICGLLNMLLAVPHLSYAKILDFSDCVDYRSFT